MVNKKEAEKIKTMKQDNKVLFRFLAGALFIFLFIFLFFFFFVRTSFLELTRGDPAPDFCVQKCKPDDYYASNNNSNFSFIRCECVTGIKFSHSEKVGGADSPLVEIFYYDAQSFEEITKKIIIERIKNAKEK